MLRYPCVACASETSWQKKEKQSFAAAVGLHLKRRICTTQHMNIVCMTDHPQTLPCACPQIAQRKPCACIFSHRPQQSRQAASMLLNTRTWQDTRTPRHQATSIGKLHFLARPSSAKTAFETQSPEHQDLAPRTPLPSSSPQNTESPCCFSIKSAVRVKGWLKN